MKKHLFLVPACVFLMFAVPAAAKDIDKDFQQSFDVKPGDSLLLRHGDGNVTIRPWDRDVIDIQIRYHVDVDRVGVGSEPEFDVDFRQSGSAVIVTEKRKSGLTIGFLNVRVFEYVYEIKAPGYLRLELTGDDGTVDIQDWRGEIDCEIDDGDVHLRNITAARTSIQAEDGNIVIEGLKGELSVVCDDGDIRVSDGSVDPCRLVAEDGKITVERTDGSFRVEVDDGEIFFDRAMAARLEVRSDDGDVEIDLRTSDALEADIQTEDGDVEVNLEGGFSLAFTADSEDGRIKVGLPDIEDFKDERHSKSGEINGGRGKLRVRTDDGSITIRER